jgi:hypothetical protein
MLFQSGITAAGQEYAVGPPTEFGILEIEEKILV